jgi:hypothetical protein
MSQDIDAKWKADIDRVRNAQRFYPWTFRAFWGPPAMMGVLMLIAYEEVVDVVAPAITFQKGRLQIRLQYARLRWHNRRSS